MLTKKVMYSLLGSSSTNFFMSKGEKYETNSLFITDWKKKIDTKKSFFNAPVIIL